MTMVKYKFTLSSSSVLAFCADAKEEQDEKNLKNIISNLNRRELGIIGQGQKQHGRSLNNLLEQDQFANVVAIQYR